jgi:hypothetical protein
MKQMMPSIVAGLLLLPQLAFSTPCADRLQKEFEYHRYWRNVDAVGSVLIVPAFFVHNHYIMANKFERATKLVRQVEAFASTAATTMPGAPQPAGAPVAAVSTQVDEITQLHRDLIKRSASKSATIQQVRASIWDMAKTNSGVCFAPPRPEEYRKHLKWDNIIVMVEKHMKVEAQAAERKKEDQKRGAEQLAAAQRAAAQQAEDQQAAMQQASVPQQTAPQQAPVMEESNANPAPQMEENNGKPAPQMEQNDGKPAPQVEQNDGKPALQMEQNDGKPAPQMEESNSSVEQVGANMTEKANAPK